jgi:hypothetical protein
MDNNNYGNYILFDGRSSEDRLGAHCLHILTCIVISHKLNIGISFEDKRIFYSKTIFMKTLLEYISKWNKGRPKQRQYKLTHFIKNYSSTCNFSLYYEATILCGCDILTYYKNNIQTSILEIFNEFEIEMDYININKENIDILAKENNTCIHLRLDDLEDYTFDYDSNIVREFYKNEIFIEKCHGRTITSLFYKYITNLYDRKHFNIVTRKYHTNNPVFSYMGQSVVDSKNIYAIINNNLVNNKYIVVTSPSGEVKLDEISYHRISSTHEIDLYLLSKTTNLILSRSTYALVSLFFNVNIKNAWVHDWGVSMSMGLNTKYDETSFNYY